MLLAGKVEGLAGKNVELADKVDRLADKNVELAGKVIEWKS